MRSSSGDGGRRLPPPRRRLGPLLEPVRWRDTKDPCPVFDGHGWHLFGSGGSVIVESWEILHATAAELGGPWTELKPAHLHGVRSERTAAPGLVSEGDLLHMFVQTDFMSPGGRIEHLVSDDAGSTFVLRDTAVASQPGTPEAGLFDAHPLEAAGDRYLFYCAMAEDLVGLRWQPDEHRHVRGPDVHLAVSVSGSWDGPWERVGAIVRQEDVPWHAGVGASDHEWGLEGPQVVELPDGRYLLSAVCFLSGPPRFQRQRIFWAVASRVEGPYEMIGLPVEPAGDGWESAEVGHATIVLDGDDLWLFYQARSQHLRPADRGEARWRYGAASWPLCDLVGALGRVP